MEETNYIGHLNNFFHKLSDDSRLNTTHVSLYMALFHFWNKARFGKEFYINRNDIMLQSRIGSKGTYHKCLHDLTTWKYIIYKPSFNPHVGSSINMYDFSTSTGQVAYPHQPKIGTSTVQVSGPYINSNKHIKHYKQDHNNLDYLKVEKNKNYNQPL